MLKKCMYAHANQTGYKTYNKHAPGFELQYYKSESD